MQIHEVGGVEHVVVRKTVARERFVSWLAELEPYLVAKGGRAARCTTG
ncbi:hypothetical protein [Burkholderia cepacia]|nr:hypothetical protein [Burkholderia cepacia]